MQLAPYLILVPLTQIGVGKVAVEMSLLSLLLTKGIQNVSKTYRQMMPKGVMLRVRGSPTLASLMVSFTYIGILISLLTI